MSTRRTRPALVALVASAALVLAGCGSDDDTASAEPTPTPGETSEAPAETPSETPSEPTPSEPEPTPMTTVDVDIEGGSVSPVAQTVTIAVGETVGLNITSDRAGELHVHSTPEQEIAFEAGEQLVEVTLDRPGTVDIEEHESHTLIVRVLVQ
jgi:hypothetical protein